MKPENTGKTNNTLTKPIRCAYGNAPNHHRTQLNFLIMKNFLLIAFVLIVSFFSACKDPDNLGLDFIENQLNSLSTDTITLQAHSQRFDSVVTSSTTYNLLGSYIDPVFGGVNAAIYTQFNLAEFSPDFGTTPHVDSLVLCLEYTNHYGEINSDIHLKIHRILEDFSADSSYYSIDTLQYSSETLADTTFNTSVTDSIYIDSVKYKFHYRIRISNDLANELISQSTDVFSSDETFTEYLKGFYITTEGYQNGGSILYLNLLSNLSKMTLYYNDSLTFDFLINTDCARYTHVKHNYQMADAGFKQQVLNKDTSLGVDNLYIQSLGGVITKINIPYITSWETLARTSINSVQMVVPLNVVASDTALYDYPAKLTLVYKKDYKYYTLIDDYAEGKLDGTYHESKNAYVFNITRHFINRVLDKQNEYSLYIFPLSSAVTANRIVLNSVNSTQNKLRLEIIYTNY